MSVTSGAEPRTRILDREQRAWDLSIRGRTQREIADAVGITQPAVSKLLRRVSARLSRDTAPIFNRSRNRFESDTARQLRRQIELVFELLDLSRKVSRA